MKKLLLFALIFTGGVFAQNVKPDYEIEDNVVKVTYYYNNGKIKEEGFYKDGKLHGKWKSYLENGKILVIGEYKNGIKIGKWVYNEGDKIIQIVYNNNVIKNDNVVLNKN